MKLSAIVAAAFLVSAGMTAPLHAQDKKEMTAEQFDQYAQRVGQVLKPRLEIILRSGQPDDIKREMAKRAASDARGQVRRSMMIPAKKKAS